MEKITAYVLRLHRAYDFHRLFQLLMGLANLLYLSYLLIIGWNNVVLLDDYAFMAFYKQYGLWGSIPAWYQQWQGRFSPQLLTNFTVKSYELTGTLLPYTLLLTAFFVFVIYRLISILLKRYRPGIGLSALALCNFSLFFFQLFLITNFEFSTFFWINVSTMYFGGIAFALWAVGEMLASSTYWYSWLAIAIGFCYAGSSAEHFSAVCTLLLAVYCAWLLYQGNQPGRRSSDSRTLLIKGITAFLVCLTALLIMLHAPGNAVRRAAYPAPSLTTTFKVGLRSLSFVVQQLVIDKEKYLLIVCFPFIYLGSRFRTKSGGDGQVALLLLISLPLLLVLFYICLLPSAYAISDLGPLRALTFLAFFLVAYVSYCSFLIGSRTQFPAKTAFALALICLGCYMMTARDRLIGNLPDTVSFARSEKARVKLLLNYKADGRKAPVRLDSLFHSGANVLNYFEIGLDSADTDHYWVNKAVADGLQLGFKIELKGNRAATAR